MESDIQWNKGPKLYLKHQEQSQDCFTLGLLLFFDNYSPNSALTIQSSALAILTIRQQNICAVLPPLQATQEGNLARSHPCGSQALRQSHSGGNLARPHPCGLQALRQPGETSVCCHCHWGDWIFFHLTNKEDFSFLSCLFCLLLFCVSVPFSFPLHSPASFKKTSFGV